MDRSGEQREPGLRVRPYALTGGRTRPRTDLPIEAIVRLSAHGVTATPRLTLERRRIAQLCVVPLSIAEVSAHLHIPLGVARVLVGDMVSEALLDATTAPAPTGGGDRPDISLLERVLHGLQAL
jgi:hypothetical protein